MQKEKKPGFRYCIVPLCKNTNRNAPDKVFFFVPRGANTWRKWCEIMKRDIISPVSCLYCCEDHFDLEEDTANYMEYKIMNLQEKQNTLLRLKKGILPHKFHCQMKNLCEAGCSTSSTVNKVYVSAPKLTEQSQIDLQASTSSSQIYTGGVKTEKVCEASCSTSSTEKILYDSLSQIDLKEASMSSSQIYTRGVETENLCEASCSTSSSEYKECVSAPKLTERSQIDIKEASTSSPQIYTGGVETAYLCDASSSTENKVYVDKAVQVNSKSYYRSKGVNVNLCAKKKDTAVSPHPIYNKTISTSPLKVAQPSGIRRALFQHNAADTASVSSAQPSVLSSSSFEPEISSLDSSWNAEADSHIETQFRSQMRMCMLKCIDKEPKMLIGVPKSSYYLIKLLSENIPLPTIDILITLKKIKLNESFSILALQFGYTQSTISRIFSKSAPLMAMKMKEMIPWPTSEEIFKRLPIAFRARYSNVVSIIDCLEIQIEKPSNAVHQSLTWSNYKKCNTLKYLLSCTPDGLVTFISDGYGGRATDVMIVEDGGYLNMLQPNTAVIADRGFKDISHLLIKRNCILIRPPSVTKAAPSTKEEVKEAKRIAALRIHVERVISRLREFHMLLPHACVDHNLIPIIDDIIIIACGLINMQGALIKN